MPLVPEAVETVWRFFDALTEDDRLALAAILDTDSDAALMYEVFGETALYAAAAVIRGPCVVRLVRAMDLTDSLWLECEQVNQETSELLGYVVFRLTERGNRWRVAEMLPWSLEAAHYLAERPDPRSDNSVAIMLTSLGLQICETTQLDGVEERLVETMQSQFYPVNVITRAICMWRDFRSVEQLSHHEDATWAAAVHRAINLLCLIEEPREQVALLYHAPDNSLVEAYNELVRRLGVVYFDSRYSPIPDPNELLRQAQAAGALEGVPSIQYQPLPEEKVEQA